MIEEKNYKHERVIIAKIKGLLQEVLMLLIYIRCVIPIFTREVLR